MTKHYTPAELEKMLHRATEGPWKTGRSNSDSGYDDAVFTVNKHKSDSNIRHLKTQYADTSKNHLRVCCADAAQVLHYCPTWREARANVELIAAAPTIARQCIEQVRELAKEKHEVERLTTLANEAFRAWDSDQDSRVGKLLAAMNDISFCKAYRPDLMEPEE